MIVIIRRLIAALLINFLRLLQGIFPKHIQLMSGLTGVRPQQQFQYCGRLRTLLVCLKTYMFAQTISI